MTAKLEAPFEIPSCADMTPPSDTPGMYRLLFALLHPETVEGYDPRTDEQKDLDDWSADWQATNESNRPQ